LAAAELGVGVTAIALAHPSPGTVKIASVAIGALAGAFVNLALYGLIGDLRVWRRLRGLARGREVLLFDGADLVIGHATAEAPEVAHPFGGDS
jgi:hypothetical protein